ncbi:MAG TPA: BON domain-containing protein, partial [Steroidobacter sp.]|nr:BON domain-containing protein [Steroidobacter sp.]
QGNQYMQSDDDDSRLARDSMERDYYGSEQGRGRGGYGGGRGERYNRGYGQGDYDQEYGQRESGQGARFGQSGRYSESGYGRGREFLGGGGGRRHYGNEMGGWEGREDEQWRNRDVHGQYDRDANYGSFSSSGTGDYRGFGGSGGSYQGGQGQWGEGGTQYGQGSQGDYNYRGYERSRFGQGGFQGRGGYQGQSANEGQGQYGQGGQGSWRQRIGQSMRSFGSGRPSGGRAHGDYRGSESGAGDEYGSRGEGMDLYGSQGSQGRQWGQEESGFRGRGPRGYKRSDERIKEDVCDCLADDERLDATNIEVLVKDGEVTLSGFTTSREDKRWAESLVERISGVKEVQNSLRMQDQQRGQTGSTQASMQGAGAGSSGTSGTRGGGDNKGRESNIQH